MYANSIAPPSPPENRIKQIIYILAPCVCVIVIVCHWLVGAIFEFKWPQRPEFIFLFSLWACAHGRCEKEFEPVFFRKARACFGISIGPKVNVLIVLREGEKVWMLIDYWSNILECSGVLCSLIKSGKARNLDSVFHPQKNYEKYDVFPLLSSFGSSMVCFSREFAIGYPGASILVFQFTVSLGLFVPFFPYSLASSFPFVPLQGQEVIGN